MWFRNWEQIPILRQERSAIRTKSLFLRTQGWFFFWLVEYRASRTSSMVFLIIINYLPRIFNGKHWNSENWILSTKYKGIENKVENSMKKLLASQGFASETSGVPDKCSTTWATSPVIEGSRWKAMWVMWWEGRYSRTWSIRMWSGRWTILAINWKRSEEILPRYEDGDWWPLRENRKLRCQYFLYRGRRWQWPANRHI